jgi:hypothetical protein
MNFIIWSYENGPKRVEESNTISKTSTHRCEPPVREAWQSPHFCHCEASRREAVAIYSLMECITIPPPKTRLRA